MKKTKQVSNATNAPLVGIICGSPSDVDRATKAREILDKLKISSEIKVMSAHRTPDMVRDYVQTAQDRGIYVLIACAGLANHLAGAVAAQTFLPVIGVPLNSGTTGGIDALLSTVQMPPGIPVATVGIDGTKNAAYLAARILTLKHPEIQRLLEAELEEQRQCYNDLNKSNIPMPPSTSENLNTGG